MKLKIPVQLFAILILIVFVRCTKDPLEEEYPSTVKDIDGNKYTTVIIGRQVWMAENLRTTMYNDGILINYFDNPGSLAGEYRWYEDKESNKNPYGAYYNYYAVQSGKLAPEGWRVATKEDYERLKTTLGGNMIAGGQMKLRETGLWNEPNETHGEDSGFNAYPAGDFWGLDSGVGKEATFWTSSEYDDKTAYYYHLWFDDTKLSRDWAKKTYFLSVRCIKE